MVVVDHHGAKIYHIQPGSGDPSPHAIAPYDPHHFLHHLTHKDQLREEGQRAPEDPGFYSGISDVLAAAGRIFVVGHGKGKSNAAWHLLEYLRMHHRETYQRVVHGVDVDLSAVTTAQLLELARQAFE
jgi:glycerol dehydrogenase-like iron-containing ADH family enzyme